MIHDVQFDDFGFQQAQRQFRTAFGRLRAGQGNEPSLFLAIEDAWNGRLRVVLAVQTYSYLSCDTCAGHITDVSTVAEG
jgi:hypothetical protein